MKLFGIELIWYDWSLLFVMSANNNIDVPSFDKPDPATYFNFISALPINDQRRFLIAYSPSPYAASHKARHLLTSDEEPAVKLHSLWTSHWNVHQNTRTTPRFTSQHEVYGCYDYYLITFVCSCLQQADQNDPIVKFHFLEHLPQNVSRVALLLNQDNLDSMAKSVERSMTQFDGTPDHSTAKLFLIQRDSSTRPTTTTQTEKISSSN